MIDTWYERWVGLKHRRIVAFASLPVWLALWIILGPVGLLIGFLLAFGAYIQLRAFPCPRCHLPIVGVRLKSFVDRCEGCRLQIFGHEFDVPDYQRNPDTFTMSRRLRRTIAGYEIASGATLMVISAFARAPLWGQIMLEGLAAFSLAGGWWLWRDDVRGYRLSRTMQLIQLIRIQSNVLLYSATAGIAIDLQSVSGSSSTSTINFSYNTDFSLAWNTGQPFGVAINLWAAIVFLLLLHAKPAAAASVGGPAVANDPVASGPTEPSVAGTLPPVGAEP
jgi:hypothetical protein